MQELQVGDGLYVMVLPIAELQEADINAQVMQPRHFERLTENIKQRGQVESLPYVHWPNRKGPKRIISGHHRARSARAAGLKDIPCLVDTWEMSQSQIYAKQVAHNELHGSPDEAILQQIVSQIDNVDDLLATGLPENWLPSVGNDDTTLGIPHADFQWHTVSLLFLSRQLEDFKEVLATAESNAEIIGIADLDQFEDFARKVIDFGRSRNIRSVAAAVATLARIAVEETAKAQAEAKAKADAAKA